MTDPLTMRRSWSGRNAGVPGSRRGVSPQRICAANTCGPSLAAAKPMFVLCRGCFYSKNLEGHGDRVAEVGVPDGAVRQLADLLLRTLLPQAVQQLRHAQPGSSIGPMSANTSPGPGFSGWALPPR